VARCVTPEMMTLKKLTSGGEKGRGLVRLGYKVSLR
jgi:hypothetical protein